MRIMLASCVERSVTVLTCVFVFAHLSIGLPVDLNSVSSNVKSGDVLSGIASPGGPGARALAQQDSPGVGQKHPTANILVTVMRRSSRFWEPWELNYNVCPPSICTASDETRPRGTGGSVFYNGDIVLDKDSEKIIYKNSLRQKWRRRVKRATNRNSRLWPDGIVPYVFGEIADKSKRYIKKAMRTIEANTCIRFRKRKLRDSDYIRYISEPGCWSNVGRVGGEQKLSIGRGCERLGTAIHEIAHSLGFWHEQARPDRDDYVEIIPENISPRYLPDFEKADPELVTSRGFPYDYESVMHYSKKAFTNLGEITIKVIGVGKALNMTIGQRDKLSTLDIAQLRDMYNCHDKEDDNATVCPDQWVKKGRSCYKFEANLKEQFSGAQRHCEKLNSKLLSIDNEKEDKIIKSHLKKKFPDVKAWRTGGRIVNGTFKWFKGDNNFEDMDYTKWGKGQPSTYSSLALTYNKKKQRVKWEGVWLGSASQMPDHAYAVICERRAKRKCVPGGYKDGRDYRGKLDHTIDGILCQKWTSQYPHEHDLLPWEKYKDTKKQNKAGLGDHNYCRNPSGDRKSRPWCFTNKKNFKWQYCDVTLCSGSIEKAQDQREKNRNKNKTNTNKKDPKKDRNANTVEVNTNRDTANKKDNNKNKPNANKINDTTGNKYTRHDQYDMPMNMDKIEEPPKNRKDRNRKDKNRRRGKKDKQNNKNKDKSRKIVRNTERTRRPVISNIVIE